MLGAFVPQVDSACNWNITRTLGVTHGAHR